MYSLHELIIEGAYLYLFSSTGWIVIKSVLGTCFLPWSIMHQDCFNCCWRNHHEAVPNTGTCCKWLSPPLPSSRVRVHLPISVIIWGTLVRTAHPLSSCVFQWGTLVSVSGTCRPLCTWYLNGTEMCFDCFLSLMNLPEGHWALYLVACYPVTHIYTACVEIQN